MTPIQKTLGGLSDVDGVIGSFVITDAGALLGSNLPAVFDQDLFAEAGPRIARLVEASAALSEGFRACILRFAEHKLFVRQVEGAFLGVMLTATGSVPALKIATNLVAKRLVALLGEPPATEAATSSGPVTHRSPSADPQPVSVTAAPPAVQAFTPPPPSVQPTSVTVQARQQMYRGRPVG
jgi:predicted regulator of Ras-like GTPase activity (Roadblock/LC7/MglB family)